MKVDGRCHCGSIRYEGIVDPGRVRLCHCSDCQIFSGSAYRVVVAVDKASFVLQGEPKIYIKTADSGARRVQSFCGDCGSPVYASSEHDPQVYVLRVGCLTQREQLAPTLQIWRRSALPWSDHFRDIETREGQ